MRRVLFWLPLLFWLAVEIYLLEVALSVSCDQPGGNRQEVAFGIFLWGLPGSILPAVFLQLIPDRFLPSGCSTGGSIGAWLLYCVVGLVQWYFILEGLEWVVRKLYRRLRKIGGGATG